MGLSSSGPSQTLAVSLAALVAVSGYASVVPILICFVPMIGIAIAYQRLNRWDQSSGATLYLGCQGVQSVSGIPVGMDDLAVLHARYDHTDDSAGIYTVDLLAPSLVDNRWAIFHGRRRVESADHRARHFGA